MNSRSDVAIDFIGGNVNEAWYGSLRATSRRVNVPVTLLELRERGFVRCCGRRAIFFRASDEVDDVIATAHGGSAADGVANVPSTNR